MIKTKMNNTIKEQNQAKAKLADIDWQKKWAFLEKHNRDNCVQSSEGYAERGYTQDHPENPILLADWNDTPKRVMNFIENNFDTEWSDEWINCDGCNKIFRCVGDSYGWSLGGSVDDNGCICQECILDDSDEYIEALLDNPERCDTIGVNLKAYKFIKINFNKFETGLHTGMNDDPSSILSAAKNELPFCEFVFGDIGASQFYTDYSLFGRLSKDYSELTSEEKGQWRKKKAELRAEQKAHDASWQAVRYG